MNYLKPPTKLVLPLIAFVLFGSGLKGKALAEEPPASEPTREASSETVSEERAFFEIRLGYPLVGDIGTVDYTGILSLGLGIGYQFLPYLAVAGSTQGMVAISSGAASTAVLSDVAYLGELMFIAGDTGLYAGVRGGFTFSTLAFTSTTFSGIGLGGAWGMRAGYTYRFPDSRFSMGPEWGWLKLSSTTFTESNISIIAPSREFMTLQLVAKWVF